MVFKLTAAVAPRYPVFMLLVKLWRYVCHRGVLPTEHKTYFPNLKLSNHLAKVLLSPVASAVHSVGAALSPESPNTDSGRKHRRITSNNKILRLLSSSDTYLVNPNQETVLESIDFCNRGDEDLRRKNYKGAIQLYAKALETGMKAAIALNNENENENNTLQWVINALCNEAYCKLQTKDVVGTIVSATTACQMSKKKSSESLEVLQEVYESIKEENKELEALEALFLLYEQQEEEDKVKPMRLRKRLSPMELGKRRSLGFRLSKLQTSLH